MTKSELILKITKKNSFLYHKDVYKIIDTLFNSITKALKDGDRVELRGFGTFSTKLRNARIGRNPKTGEPVAIPQKKMTFFKMGKSMKERINSQLTVCFKKMKIKIKICGVIDHHIISTISDLNVDYVGLVFFKKSPRNISIEKAKSLVK